MSIRREILAAIAASGGPMTSPEVFDCLTGYEDKRAVQRTMAAMAGAKLLTVSVSGELGGNGRPLMLYGLSDTGIDALNSHGLSPEEVKLAEAVEKKDEPEPECCGHCASHVMPQEEDPVIGAIQHKREPIRFAKAHAARLRALAKEEPREIVADWLNVLADELWSGQ